MRSSNKIITLNSGDQQIRFRDLLFHLSISNNQPLYEIVNYLLSHDLSSLKVSNIKNGSINNRLNNNRSMLRYMNAVDYSRKKSSFDHFLESIRDIIIFPDETWVFQDIEHFSGLVSINKELLHTIMNQYSCLGFKISEVLKFEPLEGLLHFNIIDNPSRNNKTLEKPNLSYRKTPSELKQKLENEKSSSSFSINNPTVAHGEPNILEQRT